MVMLNGGIALLMALNLAVNTAVGLMILLRCPHVMCVFVVRENGSINLEQEFPIQLELFQELLA